MSTASPLGRLHAPYSAGAGESRGRLFCEPASPSRTQFQRDRDRIIHSAAFRRLAHKTQVFIPHEGDHYRTRLTHSLEVGQIARSLARALGLDDDLAEAIALAHDLGHPPFGHAGEDALHEAMKAYGGFDHNAQTLRLVTKLERRYAAFDGLNLTFETLEGLVKHNGPLLRKDGAPTGRFAATGVAAAIIAFDEKFPLELDRFASAEAQVAALADDIAYDAHDIDDGLRAGLLELADLEQVPFLKAIGDEVEALHPRLETARFVHELTRRVITRFIEDAIAESRRRLAASGAASVEDIRAAAAPVISLSAAMAGAQADVKSFLLHGLYRRERLMRVRAQAMELVSNLFWRYLLRPDALPKDWSAGGGGNEKRCARIVCDYIAGMTDRYALAEHRRIFGAAPELGESGLAMSGYGFAAQGVIAGGQDSL